MNELCIYLYIGYAIIFIMLVVGTKLYTRESDLRHEAEMKYLDLLFKLEIEKK